MTSTSIAGTVAGTLEALMPVILVTSMNAGSGGNALIAANLISSFMQAANNFHAAGQMSSEELLDLYANVGTSIASTAAKIAAIPTPT